MLEVIILKEFNEFCDTTQARVQGGEAAPPLENKKQKRRKKKAFRFCPPPPPPPLYEFLDTRLQPISVI